jgi:hypothetical protein
MCLGDSKIASMYNNALPHLIAVTSGILLKPHALVAWSRHLVSGRTAPRLGAQAEASPQGCIDASEGADTRAWRQRERWPSLGVRPDGFGVSDRTISTRAWPRSSGGGYERPSESHDAVIKPR